MSDDRAARLGRLWDATRIPPADKITKVDKGFGPVDVLGHADTTDLLLEHDVEWNWEPYALDENGLPRILFDKEGRPRALWIRLTVHGHTRPGVGTCAANANDPYKELIGDAIRNAAMRFGLALSLWSKAEWQENGSGTITDLAEEKNASKARHPANPATAVKTALLPQTALLVRAAERAGFTDEVRRDVLQAATGKRSTKDLHAHEVKEALDAFEGLADGRFEFGYDEDGAPILHGLEP